MFILLNKLVLFVFRHYSVFFCLFSECCCTANSLELPDRGSSPGSPSLPGETDSQQQTGWQTSEEHILNKSSSIKRHSVNFVSHVSSG